jgi:hypothetical protein
MKKITLLALIISCSFTGNSQISFAEDFDAYTNSVNVPWDTFGFFIDTSVSCSGSSLRGSLSPSVLTNQLISPNIVGQSDGTSLRLSFDYKIVNWPVAAFATQPGWGTIVVQYSTNDGNNWIDIETIDDSNHTTSTTCANKSYIIDANGLPSGSDFKIRFDMTRTGGDYYVYIDNVTATQNSNIVAIDSTISGESMQYCYTNNDNTSWQFYSENEESLNISFNSGTIENCCDNISIYDGTDNTSPLLYNGNNGGDLSGLQFNSTGSIIYMEINSDDTTSCSTVGGSEWGFSVNRTLSVGDEILNNFKFYPNPSSDIITFNSLDQIENITIYSVLGEKITNKIIDYSNNKLDVSGLASGTYFMKVFTNSKTGNYKFIKI